MSDSTFKVAINLPNEGVNHPSFVNLPNSIFRHDPKLIELLEEWMKDHRDTDMEIIELS